MGSIFLMEKRKSKDNHETEMGVGFCFLYGLSLKELRRSNGIGALILQGFKALGMCIL